MITKTQSYSTADGQIWPTIEAAQTHELSCLLANTEGPLPVGVAKLLVEQREKVLDILTTGPRSRPRGRKVNGASRKRTPKAEVAA